MSHIFYGGLDVKEELSVGNGAFIVNSSGVVTSSGSNNANWMSNISIIRATTTNAGDSIKITSANGTEFSSTNIGYITLPSHSVAGQLVSFSITSDVTILLTGAHWGIGTTGDITGALLRVLAINDNGTLKWGVAYLGGRHTLLTTDTNATPSNVNLPEEVLCNSAVGSASNTCREIGFVRANFDDTGGAAEDLWAIQTGINDVVTGQSADGIKQPWNPIQTGTTSPSTTHAFWYQKGTQVFVHFWIIGTGSTTSWSCTAPATSSINQTGLPSAYTQNGGSNEGLGSGLSSTGAAVINLYRAASAAWTASGQRQIIIAGSYPAGPVASFIE